MSQKSGDGWREGGGLSRETKTKRWKNFQFFKVRFDVEKGNCCPMLNRFWFKICIFSHFLTILLVEQNLLVRNFWHLGLFMESGSLQKYPAAPPTCQSKENNLMVFP